uniref:Uncharacterized protein KIAA0895-like n=1 Tax=Saccoglossus kowalevskii TaxID=10224 RepID=A0ABM0LZ63_SACKO|nr:PREDICTED: uncharacterized protein KIAA0895-like [Saccoglossus kowalevskii]
MKKKKKGKKSGRGHSCRVRITPNRTSIKTYDTTPKKYCTKFDILNLEEQKHRFLTYGLVPRFELVGSPERIQGVLSTKRAQIRFQYMKEARRIIDYVHENYGSAEEFMTQSFGERITVDEASSLLSNYIKENTVDGMLTIGWSKDLSCTARMSSNGPHTKLNKPEARKFSLWIKDSVDNTYLRQQGILCLANHEIGTHLFRSMNDGLQPWYSCRDKFGLRGTKSQDLLETEEGLATINTYFNANIPIFFTQALTYYTSCKATEMSFEELYDHLQHYLQHPEHRWRHVMRVKRGLENPNALGGYGKDQCYFAGTVEILRNIDNIDFNLLYSGKICLDEVNRVRRVARTRSLRLPHFMQDIEQYKKRLKYMARINGLLSDTVGIGSAKIKSTRSRRTVSSQSRSTSTSTHRTSVASLETASPALSKSPTESPLLVPSPPSKPPLAQHRQ